MEETFTKIEELVSHVKEYADTHINSAKLSIAEKSSKVISSLLAFFIVILVLFFFTIFAGIAIALLLSEWIGKMYAGFLIVAVIYLLAGMIIWSAREKILRLPIMNAMIKRMFDSEDEKV